MADPNGIIARTVAALKYAVTGVVPGDWFGPLAPLPPIAPPDVKGRSYDYPVAVNLNYQPRSREKLSFPALKALADNSAIVRMVLERHKDLIRSTEWKVKAKLKKGSDSDPAIDAITAFFDTPDGDHDWWQWIGAVIEQYLVLDTVTIYGRPTRGGDLFALELIDGSTITPIVGYDGRRPIDPEPAYSQILKGTVAARFTARELLYYVNNFRVDRIYGFSKIEQIVEIGEQSIERMKSQLAYFKFGNVTDGFFTAPEGYNPDQVLSLETHWNALMQSTEARRKLPVMPHGMGWNPTKTDVLQDAFDEWLTRLVCFVFGISPTAFLKQQGLGHGSAQTDQEAAEEGGIAPSLEFIKRLMNRVLAQFFNRADLEFAWVNDQDIDAKTQSEIDDRDFRNGKKTINAIRDAAGQEKVEGGDVAVIMVGNSLIPVAMLPNLPTEPTPPTAAFSPVPEKGEPESGDGVEGNGPTPEEELAAQKKTDLNKAANGAAANHLASIIAQYLAGKAVEIANIVAPMLGLVKAAMDEHGPRIDSALDAVDWSWADLPSQVRPALAGIGVAAGKTALSDLGLFDADTLSIITKRSTDYAEARSAEMVGMKWVDGDLIANPDAAWSITQTTRDSLRSVISNAMNEGLSNDDLAKAIREATAFSADRAMTVARTETAMADVQGTIDGWRASGVVKQKQFEAAPDCCDDCALLDGEIADLDDEFSEGDPPIHPNCLPGDALVLAFGITATSERPFEGDVVVISTASGNCLTCTPNHPILTPSGWIAARLLDVGDDVISSGLGDWMAQTTIGKYAKNVPARIQDVAEAFRSSGKVAPMKVPMSAPHFHGDGEGSEVAVIWADRFLVNWIDPARCKHCGKALFVRRNVESFGHNGASTTDLLIERVHPVDRGRMSGGNLCSAAFWRHSEPFQALGLGPITPSDTVLAEDACDDAASNVEMVGDRIFGHTANVKTADFSVVSDSSRSDLNTRLLKVTGDGTGMDSGLAADLTDILSAGVFTDTIVNTSLRRFSGHVFNLETKSGAYIAQGIVTHNCRCGVNAVLIEDATEDEDSGTGASEE